jgi:hypothetical protein
MPVRVEWDNPDKTVIRYEMQGDWNWNEFRPAYNQAKAMLAEVPREVNFILDLRGSGASLPAFSCGCAASTASESRMPASRWWSA